MRPSAAAAMLSLGVVLPANAADALIEGGRLCTQQFPIQEQKYNIPTHLLAAISTTESGRYHKGLGMSVPWPWTINVEGKGYHFASKAEVVAQTRNFMAQGYRSIDVGCMQVNLKHHAKAFRSLEEAFDPEHNVAYAAKFLRDNYADLGDWIKATAAYHSRTQSYGQRYLTQIERSWNKIVAKVAAARASQGKTPSKPKAASDTPTASAPRQAPSKPIASTHGVRVIEVKDTKPRAKDEILVIRGGITTPGSALVKATESRQTGTSAAVDASPVIAPGGDTVRRVTLDNPPANPQPVGSDTPNHFVFTN